MRVEESPGLSSALLKQQIARRTVGIVSDYCIFFLAAFLPIVITKRVDSSMVTVGQVCHYYRSVN